MCSELISRTGRQASHTWRTASLCRLVGDITLGRIDRAGPRGIRGVRPGTGWHPRRLVARDRLVGSADRLDRVERGELFHGVQREPRPDVYQHLRRDIGPDVHHHHLVRSIHTLRLPASTGCPPRVQELGTHLPLRRRSLRLLG